MIRVGTGTLSATQTVSEGTLFFGGGGAVSAVTPDL